MNKKSVILLLLAPLALVVAGEFPLWNQFWHWDLRQYPTTQIETYFEDLRFLAEPKESPPASTTKITRKAYPSEKIRVLFILPYEDLRYPLELAARFPLEYDLLPVSLFSQKARSGAGFKNVDKNFTEQLLDAIEREDIDVLVTRNFDGSVLTDAERQRFETWLQDGLGWVDMGLLRLSQDPEPAPRQFLPLTAATGLRSGKLQATNEHFITAGTGQVKIRAGTKQLCSGSVLGRMDEHPVLAIKTLGKGRLVSHPVAWIHNDENYTLLMKCITWAARRETGLWMKPLEKKDDNDQSSRIVFELHGLETPTPPANLHLDWHLLHENEISFATGSLPVDKQTLEFPVAELQRLPDGRARLHYSLLDPSNHLLDWGQTDVNILASGITLRVKFPDMFERSNPEMYGDLFIENRGETLESVRCQVLACDSAGRRLPLEWNQNLDIAPGQQRKIPFRISCDWSFLAGPMGFLKIALTTQNEPERALHLQKLPFFAPRHPAEAIADWQCGVWGIEPECNVGKTTPWSGLSEVMGGTLRKFGVNAIGDGVWQYPDDLIPAAKEGFYIHTEYLSTLWGTWSKEYKDHQFQPKKNYTPPWRDAGRETMLGQIRRAEILQKLGVISYACDEEIGLGFSEVCFSEESTREFAQWAMRKYGSVIQINKVWETGFQSEQDIQGVLLNDAIAHNPENPTRWMDFRLFMEEGFNSSIEDYASTGKKLLPEAFFGYVAGPHSEIPNQGLNRARLGKSIGSCIEYLGPFFRQGSVFSNFDVLRSRHLPMLMSVAGYPYHMVPSQLQYPIAAWFTALHEGRGIMYYAAIHPSLWGKIHPGGAANGATIRIAETNADLLNGIGRLIINSRRCADIGIYYSRPSLYMWAWRKACLNLAKDQTTTAEIRKQTLSLRDNPGGASGDFAQNSDSFQFLPEHAWAAFRELATGSGYGYDVVFEDQLLDKTLLKNYKILLLPAATCLSSKELLALKEFVQQGGLLVGDLQTGIYDESGKANPNLPEVESLFGIQRQQPGLTLLPVTAPLAGNPEKQLAGFASENLQAIEAAQAYASEGKRPFAIIHPFGKGKCLYLNMIPKQGGKWGQWAWDPMQISQELRSLLTQLAAETGRPIPPVSELHNTDIVRFTRGSENFLFLSRGYETSAVPATTLKLQQPAHIYDMREKKYLGFSANLSIPVPPPGYTAAFALLDYKVEQLQVQAPESVQLGRPVKIRITINDNAHKPEWSLLNCTVFTPSGNKEPRFSRNLDWTRQSCFFSFSPTLDEQAGSWKLVVKDVLSGMEKELSFDMKGHRP